MKRALNLFARSSVPVHRGQVHRGCRAYARHPAFTLLEILIALALLVLLGAIAWPLMQNQIVAAAMPESAARMRDTLFLARSEAMKEHRRVRVRFAPNEQQPYIEVEKDPMQNPGKWEAVTTTWVKELPLVADVHVHTIESGRPAYLKPIAFDESSDEAQEDSDKQEEQENTEDFDATMPSATSVNEDVILDENRPIILFEPDGGSDWATIKLSKAKLELELTEEDAQLWVILDGRTGIAYVRDQVTEAQLADENFYVKRENLELPKEEGTDDLVLGGQDPNAAPADENGGGRFGGPGGSLGQGGKNNGGGLPNGALGPNGLAGLPDDIKDRLPGGGGGMGGGGKGGGPGGGDGKNGPGRGPNRGPEGKGPSGNQGGGRGPDAPGPKGLGGGKNDDTGGGGKGGQGRQPTDGADDLSNDLDNSDLTDDEQDNITDALNNNSNSNSNNNSNGNANQNSNGNSNLNNNSNSNSNNTNENLNANANDNSNNNNSNKP